MNDRHKLTDRKIGLALGGGAGLGWAHIGVIRCLHDHNIWPDLISGTSIGAIVGGCYAAGKLDAVEEIARGLNLRSLFSFGQLGFKQGAVLGTDKIEQALRAQLGDCHFEDLNLPFAAIAADVLTGARVELKTGPCVPAILASAAVPGVFPPIEQGAELLVDGGAVDPLPTESLHVMGAETIIAVDLQGDYQGRIERMGLTPEIARPVSRLKKKRDKTRVRGRAVKTARATLFMVMRQVGLERLKSYPADMVITPKVGGFEMADFTKAEELIEIGYAETKKQLFSLPEQK